MSKDAVGKDTESPLAEVRPWKIDDEKGVGCIGVFKYYASTEYSNESYIHEDFRTSIQQCA